MTYPFTPSSRRPDRGSAKKIAVVGAGISGLGAAWGLSRRHQVVLYEAAEYLGGHANTVEIEIGGRPIAVDTGFIVYNEHNYPKLTRLFRELDVPTAPSDMSFAVSIGRGRVEYEGSLAGLFAQPANALRPAHWRMLGDLVRFYRTAPALLDTCGQDEPTLGEMLEAGGYSEVFARRHMLPIGAAIWSASLDGIRDFPARSFVRFFVNHGLFNFTERPAWRTVVGGSREYVRRLGLPFICSVRHGTPVVGLRRTARGVEVRDAAGGRDLFDEVVLATHADRALAILGQAATAREREILGGFGYSTNRAVLHRDPRLMPRRRRVWASWNYLAESGGPDDDRVAVSYWMNRLQNLATPEPIVVTLNPVSEPAPDKRFAEFLYRHPQFDRATLAAQASLPAIQGMGRVWFCGSYCGNGFHEDGLEAGLAVARALGVAPSWGDSVPTMSPAAAAVLPRPTPRAAA